MEITNKSVLVTGVSRGIGRALVDALQTRGAARVYAAARDTQSLCELADDRVTPLTLDVTSDRQIGAVAERVERLDLLINNAGILLPDSLLTVDLSAIKLQLEVNLFGSLALTRALLPRLEASGGAVVNVLSLNALASMPLTSGYSISKGAAFSMTQSLRGQLRSRGVAVHAVLPGPVDSDMTRSMMGVSKASATEVAHAILDAVEAGEEEIFPDPMSREVSEVWYSGPIEAFERRFAAFAERASSVSTPIEVAP